MSGLAKFESYKTFRKSEEKQLNCEMRIKGNELVMQHCIIKNKSIKQYANSMISFPNKSNDWWKAKCFAFPLIFFFIEAPRRTPCVQFGMDQLTHAPFIFSPHPIPFSSFKIKFMITPFLPIKPMEKSQSNPFV